MRSLRYSSPLLRCVAILRVAPYHGAFVVISTTNVDSLAIFGRNDCATFDIHCPPLKSRITLITELKAGSCTCPDFIICFAIYVLLVAEILDGPVGLKLPQLAFRTFAGHEDNVIPFEVEALARDGVDDEDALLLFGFSLLQKVFGLHCFIPQKLCSLQCLIQLVLHFFSFFIGGDFVVSDLVCKALFLLLVEFSNLFDAGLHPVILEVVNALLYAHHGIRIHFLEGPGSLLYAFNENLFDLHQLLLKLLEVLALAGGLTLVHSLYVRDFRLAALQRLFHCGHQMVSHFRLEVNRRENPVLMYVLRPFAAVGDES